MSLRIMTNEAALSAQRNLGASTERLNTAMARLSSGSRINKASDDAAGLAISDALNANIRSLGQATRNAQDGISYAQVFEGGAAEMSNMLTRMRELAMQSSNGTLSDRERVLVDNEFQELLKELDRMSHTSRYSDRVVFDGSGSTLEFQVGTGNDPEFDRISFDPKDVNLTPDALGVDGLSIAEASSAQNSLEALDEGIRRVNEVRAKVGSIQSRLTTTVSSQMELTENLAAANSRIRDTDVAQETTNVVKEQLIRNAGIAVLAQANQTPAMALQLLSR